MTDVKDLPMPKNEVRTSGAGPIQVFHVTMVSDEEQEELNRRLRKPGEPEYRAPVKTVEPSDPQPTDDNAQER
jgi:hypothetical protein